MWCSLYTGYARYNEYFYAQSKKEEIENECLCRRQATQCHMEGRGDVEILLNRHEVHDIECIHNEGKERYGNI